MSTETIAPATRWSRPDTDTVAIEREQCVFRAAVSFAEKAEEGKPFGVRIRANSGDPMNHWWWGKVVVDLSGVRWARNDIPILMNHDPDRIVGYTTKLELVSGEGLVAEGVLSKKEPDGVRVREQALEGFPWQSSVMLEIESIEHVDDDVEVKVNGFAIHGPAVVLRKTRLREVTVTTLGADENTAAELFGDRRKGPIMSEVTRAAAAPKGEATQPTAPSAEARFSQGDIDAAAAAERARVAKIMAGAAPNQHALALSLIEKGTSTEDALLALIKGRSDANIAELDRITAAAPKPVGPDPKAVREVTAAAVPGDDSVQFEASMTAVFDAKEEKMKSLGLDRESFLGLCSLNKQGMLSPAEEKLLKGLVN